MNYTYRTISWKGEATNTTIPTNSRPYANDDLALNTLPRTQGKANPLKQWRKQLHPVYQTKSSNQTSFRQLDAPNSAVHMNTTTTDCDTTYNQIVKEYVMDASNNDTCCLPPIRRSGSTVVKKNYYQNHSKYLQSKCKTYESNSTLGAQNSNGSYRSAKCSSLYTKCNKPVIYKPSNSGFSSQGAVSASAHLLKKRNAAITNNSATLKTVYGNNFVQREAYYPDQTGYLIKYIKGDPEKEPCCFELTHTTTTNDSTTNDSTINDSTINDTTANDTTTNDTTANDTTTNDTTTNDSTANTTSLIMTIESIEGIPNGASANISPLTLLFQCTESTNDFDVSDISVTNGTLSDFSGSGASYSALFTPSAYGECSIVVNENTFSDSAGNENSSSSFIFTYITTYGSLFHTPEKFSTILDNQISGLSATEIPGSSLVSNERIMIYDTTRTNTFYTIDPYLATTDNLVVYSTLPSEGTTYRQFLSFVFQIVEDRENPGYYRIDSELHSMYSLDLDQNGDLFFNAPWIYGRNASSGYVLFDIQNDNMISYKRYIYNENTTTDMSSAFLEDQSFTGGVSYPVEFYTFNVDLSIPQDFDPDNSAYAENPRVIWPTSILDLSNNTYFSGQFQNQISTKYNSQITTQGIDTSTENESNNMLDEIFATLGEEHIRYPKELYRNFRTGLLSTELYSLSIVNGELYQNNAPYVYFTNELSGSEYHPFMVIATCGISDKPNRLIDVPQPPGDGTTNDYTQNHVTRDATVGTYLMKIPMRDYGNIIDVTDNDLTSVGNNLRDDESSSDPYSVYNYASTSSIGVAVDGVPIYPVLNNKLVPAQEKAEITNTGIHVGMGLELHYHADGHSATKNHLNLYNNNDYINYNHPPLIGFGYDGIALFGTYDTNYSTMEGYDVSLDEFGGHIHDNDDELGYHYHAHQADPGDEGIQVTGNDYTLHILMKGAWKGNINSIPEFWSNGQPKVKGTDIIYVGGN